MPSTSKPTPGTPARDSGATLERPHFPYLLLIALVVIAANVAAVVLSLLVA